MIAVACLAVAAGALILAGIVQMLLVDGRPDPEPADDFADLRAARSPDADHMETYRGRRGWVAR